MFLVAMCALKAPSIASHVLAVVVFAVVVSDPSHFPKSSARGDKAMAQKSEYKGIIDTTIDTPVRPRT